MIDLTWPIFFVIIITCKILQVTNYVLAFFFFNLFSIIKAPKARVHAGKSSRSPGGVSQQLPSSQWDNIIKFLDHLMSRLHCNHVRSKQDSLRRYCFLYAFIVCFSIINSSGSIVFTLFSLYIYVC